MTCLISHARWYSTRRYIVLLETLNNVVTWHLHNFLQPFKFVLYAIFELCRELPVIIIRFRILKSDRYGLGQDDFLSFGGGLQDFLYAVLMLLFKLWELSFLPLASVVLKLEGFDGAVGFERLLEVDEPQAYFVVCAHDDAVEVETIRDILQLANLEIISLKSASNKDLV